MKNKKLLLGGLILAGVAYYIYRKNKSSQVIISSGESTSLPDRNTIITQADSYIDKLFVGADDINNVDGTWNENVESYRLKAKRLSRQIYSACEDNSGGWSLESLQKSASKNHRTLSLELVSRVVWQLYGNEESNFYNKEVCKKLVDKVFELSI